jgi:hypothetical protein
LVDIFLLGYGVFFIITLLVKVPLLRNYPSKVAITCVKSITHNKRDKITQHNMDTRKIAIRLLFESSSGKLPIICVKSTKHNKADKITIRKFFWETPHHLRKIYKHNRADKITKLASRKLEKT